MLKKYSDTVQCSPSVVQDGVTKALEAEEECPGLLGQLCHSTAESGVAVWLLFLIFLLLHFVRVFVSCLLLCVAASWCYYAVCQLLSRAAYCLFFAATHVIAKVPCFAAHMQHIHIVLQMLGGRHVQWISATSMQAAVWLSLFSAMC